jgi:hypothetical protein
MRHRTRPLTSTVFAAVLTGTGLMSAACGPARAADDCLSEPKRETSAGGHWYYRSDPQTHRKCWYLADQAHKTDQVPSANPPPFAKKNAQQATERIQQSNADSHAEVPAELPGLRYADQPNASGKPGAEPFTVGPPRSAPEDPVLPRGNVSLNSAAPGESEPAMTNAVKDASADAVPGALPAAASDEPAAQLPADEPAISTFRLTLSLLLMAIGLAAVTAGMIFRRSGPVAERRNDVPFRMPSTAREPEEAFEEMVSLASTQDVPLFLVGGRPGPDQRSRDG